MNLLNVPGRSGMLVVSTEPRRLVTSEPGLNGPGSATTLHRKGGMSWVTCSKVDLRERALGSKRPVSRSFSVARNARLLVARTASRRSPTSASFATTLRKKMVRLV